MNAQEKWKQEYRRAKIARENFSMVEMWDILAGAATYRREAALERALEASQREVKRLHESIESWAMFDDAQVSKWFKKYRELNARFHKLQGVAHNAVSYVGAANYAEREEEAHNRVDAV